MAMPSVMRSWRASRTSCPSRLLYGQAPPKAKALDIFNKGEGGFLDRDLYPFCSNISDGKVVAVGNPNAKQLIGTDGRTLKDATGKAFGKEMFEAAQKPEGTITSILMTWNGLE